jgi:hypothetical protein
MIGVSVSDILKILDQVPVWKTLTALPKRLRDLEERMAALEATPPKKAGEPCPLCDEPMKVTAVEEDPIFGVMGMKVHTLTCTGAECSHTETRQIDPKKSR